MVEWRAVRDVKGSESDTGRAAIQKISKRREARRNPKYSKAAINCRTPKAVRGRTAILKRRETRRNPKYNKAARGRAALQNNALTYMGFSVNGIGGRTKTQAWHDHKPRF